jgi:hypothetical protein
MLSDFDFDEFETNVPEDVLAIKKMNICKVSFDEPDIRRQYQTHFELH